MLLLYVSLPFFLFLFLSFFFFNLEVIHVQKGNWTWETTSGTTTWGKKWKLIAIKHDRSQFFLRHSHQRGRQPRA